MKKILLWAVLFISSMSFSQIYVDVNASVSGDGTSWANAYKSIQDAINSASVNNEIWIAKGTYSPSATISVNKAVKIYGGFAGTETSLTQRDYKLTQTTNKTIITGDVNGDDTANDFSTNKTDNLRHVFSVNLSNNNNTLIFDGLTISNGYAVRGNLDDDKEGSAIIFGEEVNCNIGNVIFEQNYNERAGAVAVLDSDGVMKIFNCIFRNNKAAYSAAIYSGVTDNEIFNLTLVNSLFHDNDSGDTLIWFKQQRQDSSHNVNIVNCTFTKNKVNKCVISASRIDSRYNSICNLQFSNSIVWGNIFPANTTKNSIGIFGVNLFLANTVKIYNSTGEDSFSNISNNGPSYIKQNILNSDPLFISATDFSLQSSSPAFDSGDNSKIGSNDPLDLAGNPRKNGVVDRGAYERGSVLANKIYVDVNAPDNNTGTSWNDAINNIQDAVNSVNVNGEIWIAKGTYSESATTIIRKGIKIYGGFSGNESSLADRDNSLIHTANKTIITGDVDKNDIANDFTTNKSDNLSHVFSVDLTVNNFELILDGLTISNGHAVDGSSSDDKEGSAILFGEKMNCTINNVVFEQNNNERGGTVAVLDSDGTLNITNCVFRNNKAGFAAAIYSRAITNKTFNIDVINSLFYDNDCGDSLIWFRQDSNYAPQNATVTNCTFTKNTVTKSIISNTRFDIYKTLTFTLSNSIIWGNIFPINAAKESISVINSSLNLNSLKVYNSIGEDNFSNLASTSAYITSDVLDSDPLFINPVNFRLQDTSPAIDAGDNSKLDSQYDKDITGNDRVRNTTIDMGAYEYIQGIITSTSWSGTNNTSWSDTGNWSDGLPSNMIDAYIPNGLSNYPVISDAQNVKDITIENAANLTIAKNGRLTAGNVTTNDNLTIQSDTNDSGGFIASTVIGNTTYKRYVSDKWHLIGSPVDGQEVASFVSSSSLSSGSYDADNKGLAIYDNNSSTPSPWSYYKTSMSWNNFTSGKGYAIKKSTSGIVEFKGRVKTGNVQFTGVGSTNNTFEMLSNPYTSYVKANKADSFLSLNSSKIKATNSAMYFWNAVSDQYDVVNSSTSDFYLSPGQGFFIQMESAGQVLDFNTSILSHQSSGVLARTTPQTMVALSITENGTAKTTKIKYLANTGNGLDIGYDAGYFDGGQSNFGVYTKLVDGSYADTNFMLQCVASNDVEDTVIPLGIKTDRERTVTFTADAMNFPSDIKVYLEDKKTGTLTSLANGNEYTVSVNAGLGRFYLHTKTASRLSNNQVFKNTVNIYKVSENVLAVQGLTQQAKLSVFNLQGKQVFTTSVNNSNTGVRLPNLAKGMYLVNIKTGEGQTTKKIIL